MPTQANPKRICQDEVDVQPADSLNSMFGYFDKILRECKTKLIKNKGSL